ncbi:MAG TPA: ABC transporter permease, partial [Ferruginibacter sp.]|nr:ABC transporter permease [Ferruginibacter sp.]
ISHLIYGKPSSYSYLPITSYSFINDNVIVQKYVDEDTTVQQVYSISSIIGKAKNKEALIITKKYWLGTDAFGRDILSRIIIGTRVSLSV